MVRAHWILRMRELTRELSEAEAGDLAVCLVVCLGWLVVVFLGLRGLL